MFLIAFNGITRAKNNREQMLKILHVKFNFKLFIIFMGWTMDNGLKRVIEERVNAVFG